MNILRQVSYDTYVWVLVTLNDLTIPSDTVMKKFVHKQSMASRRKSSVYVQDKQGDGFFGAWTGREDVLGSGCEESVRGYDDDVSDLANSIW